MNVRHTLYGSLLFCFCSVSLSGYTFHLSYRGSHFRGPSYYYILRWHPLLHTHPMGCTSSSSIAAAILMWATVLGCCFTGELFAELSCLSVSQYISSSL